MSPRGALVADLVGLAISAVLLMFAGQPGWILLAAAGGLIATRGWARVVVALLTLVVSAAFAIAAVSSGAYLAIAGSVVALAAAAWAAVQGRTWPAMGSRYQSGPRPVSSAWDALDAGIDPTDDSSDDVSDDVSDDLNQGTDEDAGPGAAEASR